MKTRPDDSSDNQKALVELETTVEKLLVLVTKEREYAINLNGEALTRSVKSKAELMKRLEEQMRQINNCPARIKRSLSLLQFINSANLRLFQSIVRLTCNYKKILAADQLESAAYSNNGEFKKLPVSLKFVGSA